MMIRRSLAHEGDWKLVEVQFIGVSGQVCSRSYEVDGPEKLMFTDLRDAETALADRRHRMTADLR